MDPITAIQSIGFPSVVCVMMFRQYQKEREHRRQERKSWQEALEEQTEVLRDVRRKVE